LNIFFPEVWIDFLVSLDFLLKVIHLIP